MIEATKFTNWAQGLYWLTVVLIGNVIAAYILLLVANPPSYANADVYFDGRPVAQATTAGFFWAAAAVDVVIGLAVLWTLNTMRRLFDQYRQGVVLTQDCAGLIQGIGRGVVAIAALRILAFPVQTILLTWAAPVGDRQLAVGLNTSDITLLLAGGLLTVIGWAMYDAAATASENKAFV
jgi:hypothetical protein